MRNNIFEIRKKLSKKFSISYNEVGNILATENQRAKIIYAIEIKITAKKDTKT